MVVIEGDEVDIPLLIFGSVPEGKFVCHGIDDGEVGKRLCSILVYGIDAGPDAVDHGRRKFQLLTSLIPIPPVADALTKIPRYEFRTLQFDQESRSVLSLCEDVDDADLSFSRIVEHVLSSDHSRLW